MAQGDDDGDAFGGPDAAFPRYAARDAKTLGIAESLRSGPSARSAGSLGPLLRLRNLNSPEGRHMKPLPRLALTRDVAAAAEAPAKADDKPVADKVDPIITPGKLTVIVKKTTSDGKAYTKPKRQKVVLTTSTAFDGAGTFTRSSDRIKFFASAAGKDEIKFDGKDNVWKGAKLSGGVTLYAEGDKPSAAPDDVKLTLSLSGGSKNTGPDAKSDATSVELTLDICKPQTAAADPPPLSTDDKIKVGRMVVKQNTDGTHERALLIIRPPKPAGYTGELVLKATNPKVAAFASGAMTKGEGKMDPFRVKGSDVPAVGWRLWAEGVTVSDDLRDTGFRLGITGVDDDGDHVLVTVVKLVLDICKSRSKKAKKDSELEWMSAADRVKVGRFVHEQDASNHHGRALLVARAVKPKKFDGTLVLKAVDPATKADPGRTELYPTERPKAGESAVVVPKELDYKKEKNEDKKFWVQGKTKSAKLRDVEYRLFIKDHPESDAETAAVTVCKFTKLKADIPATPPTTARAGNAAARHAHEIAGAAADDWDLDDSKNQAVVLIEDSVLASDQINLSVTVEPAGVPVSWSCERDVRAAPKGDHPDIAKLSKSPTVTPDAVDVLKAKLRANAVGTFHIRPYVDCNGSKEYEDPADIEPYLVMNLILVRVEGIKNESVKGTKAIPNPAAPTAATGCAIWSGGSGGAAAWVPANAAAYSKATVKVIGGGRDGKLGLDRVFAGWCQHIAASGTSASAPQGLDIFARYQFQPPPPLPPAPPPPPVFHQEFFIFTRSGATGTVFGPPPAAAPVVEACPVMDVTPPAAPGTGGDSCTGQWGGNGPYTSPIPKVDKSIGQEWTVDTLDSPSVGLGPAHAGGLPGTMIAFRFNIAFRVDLLFWTNITTASGPTGDPADRLYSSAQTNNWTVGFGINFNPVTGAVVGAVPAVAQTMTKDANPTRRATPVDGSRLETRAPAALGVFSLDSRA